MDYFQHILRLFTCFQPLCYLKIHCLVVYFLLENILVAANKQDCSRTDGYNLYTRTFSSYDKLRQANTYNSEKSFWSTIYGCR